MSRSFLGSAIAAAVLLLFLPACSPSAVSVPSPDGNIVINISEETGQLLLSIDYKGERLIAPSPVGIEFEEGCFGTGLKMKPGRKERITDDYDMPVGKASHIHSVSNQRVVSLTSPDGRKVDICLRAFDDGVAYRYLFPEQDDR